MTFYFAWGHNNEDFDPQKHCRHDLEILSFEMTHHEGQVPLLTLKTSAFKVESVVCGYLSYQDTDEQNSCPILLFKGILYQAPLHPQQYSWILKFKSYVDDGSLENLQNILGAQSLQNSVQKGEKDLKALPARFFEECAVSHPVTQALQRQCAFVEVDRLTQKVSLCDMMRTEDVLTVQDVFENSVKINLLESPYTQVHVSVVANWVQKDQGEVDLSERIHKAFAEGRMNTFSPTSMERSFPQVGDRLYVQEVLSFDAQNTLGAQGTMPRKAIASKRSGYRIVESKLSVFDTPFTGILNTYPKISPPFFEKDTEDAAPKAVRFKRVWYQTHLVVEWIYAQHRREIIDLTLVRGAQSKGVKRTKHVTLTLKNIETFQGSSFFKSKMGKGALLFAHDYGKCFLRASMRCIELVFRMPLKNALQISTQHSIDVTNMIRTQGFCVDHVIVAKIVSYTLVQKGLHGYAMIRCAFSMQDDFLGDVKKSAPMLLQCAYVEEGFMDAGAVTPHSIESVFDALSQSIHPKGIVDTGILHTTDIVDQVVVMNAPREQLEILQQNAYPRIGKLKDVLKQCPTQFSIHLKDIRTHTVLEERATIMLDVEI